jgi:hypothetical protein
VEAIDFQDLGSSGLGRMFQLCQRIGRRNEGDHASEEEIVTWCDCEGKMAVDAITRMGGDRSSIAIELGLCNADGARGVIHIVSYQPVVYAALYSL